ncbi:GntR family transcriptional regulator [Streptomyces pactum]|uniref:GntR family transcriptional regulator n=1 Tax=Streptomyces pactum TaxID=68249 RepID=A0ABS0NSB0_9ACTN|nr:GntR family transcriptional regulator [Streptomyces pactum]MBH5338093.1 GntR family transcriptional regulator [Streptomyces pactum]
MEQMRNRLRSADVEAKLREDLAGGVYAPGDRLPDVESLAEQLGKHTRAVLAAYRRLVEDGVLLEGLLEPGYFVAAADLAPEARTTARAVRAVQDRLLELEGRLGELTERMAALERLARETRCRCRYGHSG